MQLVPRIKGLKALQNTFDAMTRPELLEDAARQTQDEVVKLKTRSSLLFVNHVFRRFLRDAMRRTRR